MPLTWITLGLGLGVLLSVPIAYVWTRRTERRVRRLEQRARTAQRLAELGTLTGGLAHEIKNPLSTVNLNAQLIQEDLDDLIRQEGCDDRERDQIARVQRRLGSLMRETQRLRDILEDFLKFAGRMKLDLQPIDLNAMLSELVDFFAPQAEAAKVQLRTQLDAAPALVAADEGLLKQAVLNLLINATQAMTVAREQNQPHGGASELIVRTQRKRELGQSVLVLQVIDTGPGIAPDVLPQVFQPYFTTKRGGTGLGLPTTRRIIEEHHGWITAHADPAKGTAFTITLPSAASGSFLAGASGEHPQDIIPG
jgi:signal transduction histidine kinase